MQEFRNQANVCHMQGAEAKVLNNSTKSHLLSMTSKVEINARVQQPFSQAETGLAFPSEI